MSHSFLKKSKNQESQEDQKIIPIVQNKSEEKTEASKIEVLATQICHSKLIEMELLKQIAELKLNIANLEIQMLDNSKEEFRKQYKLVVGRKLKKDEQNKWWWIDPGVNQKTEET